MVCSFNFGGSFLPQNEGKACVRARAHTHTYSPALKCVHLTKLSSSLLVSAQQNKTSMMFGPMNSNPTTAIPPLY